MVHMDFLNQKLAVQKEQDLISIMDGEDMILKMTREQETVFLIQ